MIPVSSAFAAANAALQKKPNFVIQIDGYSRAFTLRGSLDGGPALSGFGGGPPREGNVLLAFMVNGDGGSTPGISDSNFNTWTHILDNLPCASGLMNVWWAIANSGTAPEAVTFTTGGNRSNSAFMVVELPAAYASFVFAHNAGSGSPATVTTSDGDTLNIPNGPNVAAGWTMFEISFGATSGMALGFVNFGLAGQGPDDSGSVIIEKTPGGGPCYIVRGPGLPSDVVVQAGGFGNIGGFTSFPGTVTLQSPTFDWIVSIDPLRQTVSDLDGSSDLSDLVFNLQDRDRQITADLASFVFEGKLCKLLAGFAGMDLADYVTLRTMTVDTVDCDNDNQEYKFTCSDVNLKKLSKLIYTTGDNPNFATDSNNPRTVSGHPLDILMSALTQVGATFDAAKIAYYRDFVFSGDFMKFVLTTAPEAKEFITKELMMPRGMYIRPNNLGVLTINSFYPVSFPFGGYTPDVPPVMEAVVSLNPSDVNQTAIPVPVQAPLVNEVIFRFDDDGSKLGAERVVDWKPSIAKYGLVGAKVIESKGMRSAFQGHAMAQFIGRLICIRYGSKNLTFDPVSLQWNACALECGDIISVANPYVPDREAGVLGITGKMFESLDVTLDCMQYTVQVKLLDIDLLLFKEFLITPNGEADFAAASDFDKNTYMFQSDASGKYSTGAPGNTLG
jgi:hypothetical protein